jgi:ribosomal protein L13E
LELPRILQIEKPIVKFRSKSVVATRSGRGYSLKELNEAGIKNHYLAKMHGIPIDKLRNTTHQENIDKLRDVSKKINEPKIIVREKPSEDKNAAKPKVIKKRTIRRKLIRND